MLLLAMVAILSFLLLLVLLQEFELGLLNMLHPDLLEEVDQVLS